MEKVKNINNTHAYVKSIMYAEEDLGVHLTTCRVDTLKPLRKSEKGIRNDVAVLGYSYKGDTLVVEDGTTNVTSLIGNNVSEGTTDAVLSMVKFLDDLSYEYPDVAPVSAMYLVDTGTPYLVIHNERQQKLEQFLGTENGDLNE